MRGVASSGYSSLKVLINKFWLVRSKVYDQIDQAYNQTFKIKNELPNIPKRSSIIGNRIREVYLYLKMKIPSRRLEETTDDTLKTIYKKEILMKKINRELIGLRIKNVFCESFFIQKTYTVENAFKKMQKEGVKVEKYYTIFYKLYRLTLGKLDLNLRRDIPRALFLFALGSLIKIRYDYYSQNINSSNKRIEKLGKNAIFEMFGKDLDQKFKEAYFIEQDLSEVSVRLTDYVNNKKDLEERYKTSFPGLAEFFDELMVSDLRVIIFTLACHTIFSISMFYYQWKKKKQVIRTAFFKTLLYFYLFRETTEYLQILNYIKYQDQLSRFILTRGRPEKENLDEIFKYQFSRKNLRNI